jgi:hypothetical protein
VTDLTFGFALVQRAPAVETILAGSDTAMLVLGPIRAGLGRPGAALAAPKVKPHTRDSERTGQGRHVDRSLEAAAAIDVNPRNAQGPHVGEGHWFKPHRLVLFAVHVQNVPAR